MDVISIAVSSGAVANGASADDPDASLPHEQRILRKLGFSKPLIARAADLASRNGTTIERELLAECGVQEGAYYAALARYVGLPYVDSIAPSSIVDMELLDLQLTSPNAVRVMDGDKAPMTAIVPELERLDRLVESLAAMPGLVRTLVVAAPSIIRAAVWQAGAERRVRSAVSTLFEDHPGFSARIVLSGWQGFVLGIAVSAALSAVLVASQASLLLLHAFLSLLYLASLSLRMAALVHASREPRSISSAGEGKLPVYTVMVALYREAPVAGQLLQALNRLDWPRSLLDIKLVCEADDAGTIAALKALKPGPHVEIVEVPAFGPRTKPKALSYALGAARGDYVAIYDAEDRPHPGQLREAHARFAALPETVACLQAPLIITNGGRSIISALFALEYSALFRRLLPVLARHRMPLPLGGTSNHFRTAVLRRVGGWDPYNVTEDADLGMRLYRLGYRSEVLHRQTLEDAPVTLPVWMRQRTRWFKGWLQTWLVVMRDSSAARRDMGWKAFLVFQLLFAGVLISALLHPAIFLFLALSVAAMLDAPTQSPGLVHSALLVIDFVNVFGAYACFVALGASAMIAHEKKLIGWRWMAVPLYWIMMTVAAWRAIFELRAKPFFWHKTPHAPSTTVCPDEVREKNRIAAVAGISPMRLDG